MARILLTTPSRREYPIEGMTFRALRSTCWNVRSTFGAEPRQNVSSYVEFGFSKKTCLGLNGTLLRTSSSKRIRVKGREGGVSLNNDREKEKGARRTNGGGDKRDSS